MNQNSGSDDIKMVGDALRLDSENKQTYGGVEMTDAPNLKRDPSSKSTAGLSPLPAVGGEAGEGGGEVEDSDLEEAGLWGTEGATTTGLQNDYVNQQSLRM